MSQRQLKQACKDLTMAFQHWKQLTPAEQERLLSRFGADAAQWPKEILERVARAAAFASAARGAQLMDQNDGRPMFGGTV